LGRERGVGKTGQTAAKKRLCGRTANGGGGKKDLDLSDGARNKNKVEYGVCDQAERAGQGWCRVVWIGLTARVVGGGRERGKRVRRKRLMNWQSIKMSSGEVAAEGGGGTGMGSDYKYKRNCGTTGRLKARTPANIILVRETGGL